MKIYPFFLAAVAAVMISCSSANTAGDGYESIQGLPVRTAEYSKWSFVNPQGHLFLIEEFKGCPSSVIGGLFTYNDGDSYRLCRLNGNSYEVILDSLLWAGFPSEGLTPVVRQNGKIEIVDKNGETVFYLPNNAVQSARCFINGMLSYTAAEGFELLKGVVDKNGKIVLAPQYSELQVFGDNLFYVLPDYESGQFKMVDSIGNVQTQWPDSLEYKYYNDNKFNYVDHPYIVGYSRSNNTNIIFNKKGEVVLNCPKEVRWIKEFFGDKFVYSDYRDGVMDLSGKVIVDGLGYIFITSNAIFGFAKTNMERYSLRGEFQGEAPALDFLYDVKGFGYVRYVDNSSTYGHVYNANLNEVGEKFQGSYRNYGKGVYSDFLDVEAIVTSATQTLENMEKDGWVKGRPLSQTKNASFGEMDYQHWEWYITPVQKFSNCEMTIYTKCSKSIQRWENDGYNNIKRMNTPIEYGLLCITPNIEKDHYDDNAKQSACQLIEEALLKNYESGYTIQKDSEDANGVLYIIQNDEEYIELFNAKKEIRMYFAYKNSK